MVIIKYKQAFRTDFKHTHTCNTQRKRQQCCVHKIKYDLSGLSVVLSPYNSGTWLAAGPCFFFALQRKGTKRWKIHSVSSCACESVCLHVCDEE